MSTTVDLDAIYAPSDDIVVREIEGEIIIVPLVSGLGDMEGDLFTFNETARPVWRKLDGRRTLREVVREAVAELEAGYEAPARVIEQEVIGLVEDLLEKGILARKA